MPAKGPPLQAGLSKDGLKPAATLSLLHRSTCLELGERSGMGDS